MLSVIIPNITTLRTVHLSLCYKYFYARIYTCNSPQSQNREGIRGFERKKLCGVANFAEQIYFVGGIATTQLHFDDRASPSGKAPVFGTGIRGFESLRPSQNKKIRPLVWSFY